MPKELLLKNYENLKKTILLFETALKDVVQILNKENFSEQDLKSFDVFSFRFQKLVEMFLYFLRSLEIYLYGQSSDTLRDRLLRMEKLGIISDIETWFKIRILRNKIVHTYEENFIDLIKEVLNVSNQIFEDYKKLENYIKNFL
ncbi:MAG: hypothetical protein ACO2O6_04125 [Candidatus Hydrothermia bacterium]|jgi:hypothetical protein